MRHALGFTLLELMVVVAIAALATAGVTLAWRDSDAERLEREALRLTALIESARAQSRVTGLPVAWRATPGGFEFLGLRRTTGNGAAAAPQSWLFERTSAAVVQPAGAPVLVLGPEPVVPEQRLVLALGDHRLAMGTDGVGPFKVQPDAAP